MSSDFWTKHDAMVVELHRLSHLLAIRSIHAPGADDWQDLFEPELLLDYSSRLKEFLTFLADHQFIDDTTAFVNTESHGPVSIEAEDDGFRVYRFDRIELTVEDVAQDDVTLILEGYRRLKTLPL